MVLQKYFKLHASSWFKTWDKREQYFELHIFAEDFFWKFTNRTRSFLYKNIVFQKSKIFRQEILEIS